MGTAVDWAKMSDRTTKATRTPSSRIEVSNNILAPFTPQRFSNQIASNTVILIWTPNWWKNPPIYQQLVPNYKRPLDSAGSIRSSHRIYRAPPLARVPAFQPPLSPDQGVILSAEIADLERKEAIHRLSPNHIHLGFYSNVFAVPKKGGGWRPVINLKKLNAFIHTPHVKMENISHLKDLFLPGDFLVKVDLKDA